MDKENDEIEKPVEAEDIFEEASGDPEESYSYLILNQIPVQLSSINFGD